MAAEAAALRPVGLAQLDPIELADVLLAGLAERSVGSIVLEPLTDDTYALRAEVGQQNILLASLPSALAEAAAARLGLIAQLALGAPEAQLARVRVQVEHAGACSMAALLVALRSTARGLVAELHRIDAPASEAPTPLLAGAELADLGRYQLQGELGRGGMGVVYRAVHATLEKPVAIKVLQPALAQDPLLQEQFVVEARAAARIRHPGIVDVTDFGRLPDGRAFIVMELVEWPTLTALLAKGALGVMRALQITRGLAEVLRAAAAHGVVHRDLKPANVFVGPDDQVKVGDFGLAWIFDRPGDRMRAAQAGTIMGTVAYMSPEQSRGESTDPRSDIFSLGCVLYEMVTGRLPEASATEPYDGLHEAPPLPPDPTLPDVVSRIITRALAPRSEARYQSADDLLAALAQACRALEQGGWRSLLPR